MSARGVYYKHGRAWTNLYRAREAAGLSQSEAASALGISERTYRSREALPQTEVSAAVLAAFRATSANPARFDRDIAGLRPIVPKPAAIAPADVWPEAWI